MAIAVLATMLAAAAAGAQSTPDDPLGINVMDDTSIARQRGALQGGTNSIDTNSYRNRNAVDNWSFENGHFKVNSSYRHW
jgi:hypothetical protein